MSIADTLLPEFDQETSYPGYSYEKTETLLKSFDKHARLIDVPVPSIYGPSADEPMPGF